MILIYGQWLQYNYILCNALATLTLTQAPIMVLTLKALSLTYNFLLYKRFMLPISCSGFQGSVTESVPLRFVLGVLVTSSSQTVHPGPEVDLEHRVGRISVVSAQALKVTGLVSWYRAVTHVVQVSRQRMLVFWQHLLRTCELPDMSLGWVQK